MNDDEAVAKRRVRSLEEWAPGRRWGGKAGALGRLMGGGFPVPPGYVLEAEAWQAAVASLGEVGAAELGEALRASPLDPALRRELAEALPGLAPGPVAVRSSGLDEDGAAHSFAGQHHTSLGVPLSLSEVDEAVRACWASACSAHVTSYRGATGAAGEIAPMAVLIQRMVAAEVAGVAFTRDPLTGDDRIVIEAVPGLGEALVSGRVTPDRFHVTRDLQAIEREVGERPTGLSDDTLREIARLALRVEAAQGSPQDIEWALEGGRLWLLQARPVTSLAPRSADEEAGPTRVWASSNARELFPRPATPMTAEVLDRVLKGFFGPTFRLLGVDVERAPIAGVVAGRIYLCMNTFMVFFRVIPGMGRRSPADLFGGDGEAAARAMAAVPNPDPLTPPPGLGQLLWGMGRLGLHLLRGGRRGRDRALAEVRAENQTAGAAPIAALDEPGLLARFEEILTFGAPWTQCAHGTAPGIVAFELCNRLATRWLGAADANVLFSGVGAVDSALAARELIELAERARDAGVHERSGEVSVRALRLEGGAGIRSFLSAFDGWMGRHGHHARGEVDIAIPRMYEDPDAVLRMVLNLCRAGPGPSADRHREAREALMAALRARLGPLRSALLKALLRRGRAGLAYRENIKSELVRRVGLARACLLLLGARLAERGRLQSPEQVFYLQWAELAGAWGEVCETFHARVRAREAESRRWAAVEPPSVIIGRIRLEDCLPPPPSDAKILRGLAVSPGMVEGRARVIREAEEAQVESGEILVAPFTDPGWAPHFVFAAGLVVDEGGMLSHGSVVARELGLPAVVNVREGTRAIRTGDHIRLDAYRGEVTVLARAGERPPPDPRDGGP